MRAGYAERSIKKLWPVKTTFIPQTSHCQNFWWKTDTMKAENPGYVIKNKKQCFSFCLDGTYILVWSTHILQARSDAEVKLHAWKVGRLERNLSTSDKERYSIDKGVFNDVSSSSSLRSPIDRCFRKAN